MASEDHTFWVEFLELYKELPALWRVKSPEYSNRIIKNQSYEKLVQKAREKIPTANRDYVVKKVNNFRTSYRKELKKVKQSEKSGAGLEDIYEPSLWYYYLLNFLEEQEDSNPGRSTMDDDVIEEYSPRPKKKKLMEEDNLIKLACEHLQQGRQVTTGDDAKGWSIQLQEMEPKQRTIARKLISDILFYGSLGNLETFHAKELPKLLEQNSRPESVLSMQSVGSPISNVRDNSQVFFENSTDVNNTQPNSPVILTEYINPIYMSPNTQENLSITQQNTPTTIQELISNFK